MSGIQAHNFEFEEEIYEDMGVVFDLNDIFSICNRLDLIPVLRVFFMLYLSKARVELILM